MSKPKQNAKSGNHKVGLYVSEFIVTGLLLTLFTNYSYINYLAIVSTILFAPILVIFFGSYILKQIPTLLGYGDLASNKANLKTKKLIKSAKNANRDYQTLSHAKITAKA
jgi:uncharacterized membrane protein